MYLEYAQFVSNNASIICEMVKNAIRNGINVQTYKRRAKILTDIFLNNPNKEKYPQTLAEGLIHLNCASTANHLLKQLFTEYPSYKEYQKCINCNYQREIKEETIVANLPNDEMTFMQEVLDIKFGNNLLKCEKCDTISIER